MKKTRVIIFGTGRLGKQLYSELKSDENVEVIAFLDNYNIFDIDGIHCVEPKQVSTLEYDVICLGALWIDEMIEQLISLGVEWWRINTSWIAKRGTGARDIFLENLADEIRRKNLKGYVAEAGVFKGEFAQKINKFFPDRRLFLFDTFEGFDERDVAEESEKAVNDIVNSSYFSKTNESMVLHKMENPNMVEIRKGYIPDTLCNLPNEFVFVNLDLDLYKPTLEALRFFWPRIVIGGGILIHDFFDVYTFPNLKKGVINFCEENDIRIQPIGDGLSVYLGK